MADDLHQLRACLESQGDRQAVLERWMQHLERRCWQVRASPEVSTELRHRCASFLDALATAVSTAPSLATGSADLREPIRLLSFLSGWLVGARLSVSVGIELCHGLEVAVGVRLQAFYQDLVLVVGEAYAAGVESQARAHHQQIIEKSQVVCMLGETVAALLLVGDPDRAAVNEAVGRLVMLRLMREAEHVVVDLSGLVAVDEVLPNLLQALAAENEALQGRVVLVSGATRELVVRVCGGDALRGRFFEDLEQGLRSIAFGTSADAVASASTD